MQWETAEPQVPERRHSKTSKNNSSYKFWKILNNNTAIEDFSKAAMP